MKRRTIFGSATERQLFKEVLSRYWNGSTGYELYPNVPFGMMPFFDIDGCDKRLLETSIDFVVCDLEGVPIAAVDFDGIGEGRNYGIKYVANSSAAAARRSLFELKLRASHFAQFPYFIVGSMEFVDLGPDINLTIVDGLLGAVVAQRELAQRFREESPKTDWDAHQIWYECQRKNPLVLRSEEWQWKHFFSPETAKAGRRLIWLGGHVSRATLKSALDVDGESGPTAQEGFKVEHIERFLASVPEGYEGDGSVCLAYDPGLGFAPGAASIRRGIDTPFFNIGLMQDSIAELRAMATLLGPF